jgi:predicted transcriptional regulator of viral defense system
MAREGYGAPKAARLLGKPAMKGASDRSWRLIPRIGEERANPDQVVAAIAARQHGVVCFAQLQIAGLHRNAVSVHVRAGRLHRLHRGIYAVGHTRLSFEGRCLAAVLALGESAVISHHSAGAIWGMLKPTDGPIHITLPGNGGRKRRRGIAIHRSGSLVAGVSTRRHGIAVTKPARTLRDLAAPFPRPCTGGLSAVPWTCT